MINICLYCNPNYENEKRIQSINKNIDLVTQFIVLYNSIKKNWKSFEYDITLFYNKNIPWSQEDWEKVNSLKGLNIISVDKPDFETVPWQTRIPCFNHELKRKGTHRIVLDCDMIALDELKLDLNCDFQAMYSGTYGLNTNQYNYMIDKYGYKDILKNDYKYKNDMWINYNVKKRNYKNILPYFNAGIIILKEELCQQFVDLWKPSLELVLEKNWNSVKINPQLLHMAVQYTLCFSLLTVTDNWKPFDIGTNYLIKMYNLNKFKNKISLIHYCGKGAGEMIKKEFPEYFNDHLCQ